MNEGADTLALSVEAMGLRPDAQFYMRPADPSQAQTRYAVEFLGAIRGKSLLFSLPQANGEEIWMPIGHEYVFHAVEGMYAYGFTSHVLRARHRPFPYVHFAWPGQISARQVRKAYRVRMRQPVTYADQGGQENRALLLHYCIDHTIAARLGKDP
jgi:c-di-GMP-binding flagellar brake protein YcgR